MPFDNSAPNRHFRPAPDPFVSIAAAVDGALALIDTAAAEREARYAAIEAEAADMVARAQAVMDAAPLMGDAEQVRRAREWAVSEHIRQALVETLQREFTDEQIAGAASIVVGFPTAWPAYSDAQHGTPPALLAYKSALRELADPSLTVARLEQLARRALQSCARDLVSGQCEIKVLEAHPHSERAMTQLAADVRSAGRLLDEAADLLARAKAFAAERLEAATPPLACKLMETN